VTGTASSPFKPKPVIAEFFVLEQMAVKTKVKPAKQCLLEMAI